MNGVPPFSAPGKEHSRIYFTPPVGVTLCVWRVDVRDLTVLEIARMTCSEKVYETPVAG